MFIVLDYSLLAVNGEKSRQFFYGGIFQNHLFGLVQQINDRCSLDIVQSFFEDRAVFVVSIDPFGG